MKLGTLKDGTRDGKLVILSRDLSKFVDVSDIAPNLQYALDNWGSVETKLLERAKTLEDNFNSSKVDFGNFLSPLPRAYEWIDGSAYINHIVLVRKARNAEPPATLKTDPLVYQGGSGTFLSCTANIEHFSEDFGIDFESEVGVIVDDVPIGTKKDEAMKHIKLLVILNDVTLRNIVPAELEKGFGFFVSKPSTAFGPVAVTPDELGESWGTDGRVYLPLISIYNGKKYGDPECGPEMHFSFLDLIEHCCKTRALTAGTIIGSGTISNVDTNRGSSCLAEKRMLEKIETGKISTPFMKFGDTIEIEMFGKDGKSIFGKISQKVVQKHK